MITNREKLNQMSNEELAEILDDIESFDTSCGFCTYADISPEKICSKPREKKCIDGILQWLNQEVKDSE